MTELADTVLSVLREVPDFPTPGILFRDVAPLFANPQLFAEVRDWFCAVAPEATCVAGIEARGFLLGAPVALAMNLPFIPVRKAGKLPGKCHQLTYDLEYASATIEVQEGAFAPLDRVLVIDDVLATGGTARAATDLVHACGASTEALAVLLELSALGGRQRMGSVETVSLATN